jgi:hypothetical protein
METAAIQFPWRQLGELLIDEELLTERELEQALLEQTRSGRLLGQILVSNSYLSAFSLARVLSEQHGVSLSPMPSGDADPVDTLSLADPPEFAAAPWRPLGKVLIEQGFLTEAQLGEALTEQQESHARLGEILVTRGLLSGSQLAQALTAQHGVELDPESELETAVLPAPEEEPAYKVFEVHFEPGWQRRVAVHESPNFLEAVDFAFEYVEQHEPAALEIHRTHGAADETVWNYSASRAAAVSAERKDLVDTFGFDPIRWGKDT